MTLLAVVYVLIGVLVYAFSDTSSVSSAVSRPLIAPSYGAVQKYLAAFVIFLWPVWLLTKVKFSR